MHVTRRKSIVTMPEKLDLLCRLDPGQPINR